MGAKWTGGVADRRGDGPPTVDEWRPLADGDGDGNGERSAALADAGDAGDGTTAIAYRTTVADPRDDESQRALLELRGAPPRAEIWLNGMRIGTRDCEFGPFRTTFDPRPENELVVCCERPASAADGDFTSTVARLDAVVEARPQTFCRRLEARPRLTDDGGAIDVEIEVDAGRAVADSITLSVRPEGFRGGATMRRLPVDADAGERVTVTESLEIRDPSLWWPGGYGPQHRYSVQARLGADEAATTVAFREVDRDGDNLSVNGERVRLRGFTRASGGNPVADVRRAAAANANLLRVRGHVPSEPFYAACDEAGILVWQELSPGSKPPAESGSGDRGDVSDAVRDRASALEDAYGHHPSFAIYGFDAATEGESATGCAAESQSATAPPTAAVDGLYGSGFLTKLRFRYRLRRTTADGAREPSEANAKRRETVPGDRPVISSVGPPGTDPDAAALYPGWRYLAAADIEWLLERRPDLGRFVAAFGAGSLAADVDPADVAGLDATVLADRLGAEPGVEETQSAQARTLKAVAEGLRRRGATALAAERLRDADSGGGTGVLTAEGDEKPAYGAIADAFEPVQAVLEEPVEPGSVGIVLCNDTRETVEATVAWAAGDASGETTVAAEPVAMTGAGTAEIPPDATRVRLTVTADDRTIANRYHL